MATTHQKDPAAKEVEANVPVADEPKVDEGKCDNHPQRKALTFTGNGSYEIHLCDECKPSWFTEEGETR